VSARVRAAGGRPRDRWQLRITQDLAVSFQRFAWPPEGIVRTAPASLGALPVARFANGNVALLPVAPGEAFWVGFDARGAGDARVALCAELASDRRVDALSGREWREDEATFVSARGRPRIEGIARPDGAFAVLGRAPEDDRASCTSLSFRVGDPSNVDVRVDVEIVDYAAFRERSGEDPPSPLDPGAAYRGQRLP
jgi:hypothetical protein